MEVSENRIPSGMAHPFMHGGVVNNDPDIIPDVEQQEPDMSQVQQEMPSQAEYQMYEVMFSSLDFASPEFRFKLMRFVGASRNLIDALKTSVDSPTRLVLWHKFIDKQKDHALLLDALTTLAFDKKFCRGDKAPRKTRQKGRRGRKNKRVKSKKK